MIPRLGAPTVALDSDSTDTAGQLRRQRASARSALGTLVDHVAALTWPVSDAAPAAIGDYTPIDIIRPTRQHPGD